VIIVIIEDNLDPFQKMRRERIKSIEEILKEKKEVGRKSFLASISIKYGIHPRTLKQYLEDLATLGKIEIKNEQIKWLENE